jgi:hypothetical protein
MKPALLIVYLAIGFGFVAKMHNYDPTLTIGEMVFGAITWPIGAGAQIANSVHDHPSSEHADGK